MGLSTIERKDEVLKDLAEPNKLGISNARRTYIRVTKGDFDKEIKEYATGDTGQKLHEFVNMIRDL